MIEQIVNREKPVNDRSASGREFNNGMVNFRTLAS